MHAMRRRCFQNGSVRPNACATCLMHWCCQVSVVAVRCSSGTMMPAAWSPKCWGGVHHQFWRGLLGMKGTTHHLIALAKSGRYLLAVHWQKHVDKFRQRICNVTRTVSDNPLFWAMFDGTTNVVNMTAMARTCCSGSSEARHEALAP